MQSGAEYDSVANDLRMPLRASADGTLYPEELVRYATLAASSHNTQPWKFRIGQDTITILPDYSRRCPVVDPDDAHLFRSLGCAAENLVHASAAQGFSATVRFDAGDDSIVVALHPDPSAQPSELFEAISKRQCVKLPYDGTTLEESKLRSLEQAARGKGVRAIMLLSDEQKETVIEYVTKGNLVQLSDPAFREELVSWIRFNPGQSISTGDGLAGRTSGRPSLPAWLGKLIIGLVLTSKGQAATDAKNIRTSAGVAVFVSSRNDKATWVEAGRCFQRFALQATANDVRMAFVNQPLEVRSLRPQFESWLGLDGEHAQLIVRFGHGPTAPFSLRRPVEEVIVAE